MKNFMFLLVGFLLFSNALIGTTNPIVIDAEYNQEKLIVQSDNVVDLEISEATLIDDRFRKLSNCLCELSIGLDGITICGGQRFKCKRSGFEPCTTSGQETACSCDC